jgi:hypothetical protein
MVDAMRSYASGRELAALGRVTRAAPMLPASKPRWAREADGLARRPSGRRDSPGAAQTRQIASRAREIVASTIWVGSGAGAGRLRSPSAGRVRPSGHDIAVPTLSLGLVVPHFEPVGRVDGRLAFTLVRGWRRVWCLLAVDSVWVRLGHDQRLPADAAE